MASQVLYGFYNLQDLFNRRVTEVGVDVVETAVQTTMAEHNRQLEAFRSLFATTTTEYKTRFKSAAASRLQPLDENGRARKVKPGGAYDIELPIKMAGTAWGANFVTLAKMRVEDVNAAMVTLTRGDIEWMRDNMLAAIFSDADYIVTDEEYGDLTIRGMANGDATKYQIQTGASDGATADHYLAQVNPIADGADNPFPAIYNKITAHPENSGEVIVLVHTDEVASIKALTNFVEYADSNITLGANADQLTGRLNVAVPGRIIGYVDGCWIVEWGRMPSGYMVAVSENGDRPLSMRQDVETALQGFIKVAERNDYPFYESQYIRRAGFGGWNRVGAVVYRIGNAAYAVPGGYESPLA